MPHASSGHVVAGPDRADDRADLAALPFDMTDRAIERYHEARREAEEAYRVADVDHRPGLEKWTDLATAGTIDAERRLVRAILTWSPGFSGMRTIRPTSWRWPIRGVRSNGVVYLAIADPCRDGEDGGTDHDLMRLAVVEAAAIVDLDDVPDLVDLGPEPAPVPPPYRSPLDGPHVAMTDVEKTILASARTIGEREALRRILCPSDTAPAREMDAPAGARPQESHR